MTNGSQLKDATDTRCRATRGWSDGNATTRGSWEIGTDARPVSPNGGWSSIGR
jgi:hypothetical protein